MSRAVHRFVTWVAVPGMAAAIMCATGPAGVANATTGNANVGGNGNSSVNKMKRPSTNVVRSPTVYAPTVTAPKSGIKMVEHAEHPGLAGPEIKRPESKLDMSTHSRAELVAPSSN